MELEIWQALFFTPWRVCALLGEKELEYWLSISSWKKGLLENCKDLSNRTLLRSLLKKPRHSAGAAVPREGSVQMK